MEPLYKKRGKKSKNTCFQRRIGGPPVHLLLFAQFFGGGGNLSSEH